MATAPNKEKLNADVERCEKIIDAELESKPDAMSVHIPAGKLEGKDPVTGATVPLGPSTKAALTKKYESAGWTSAKWSADFAPSFMLEA